MQTMVMVREYKHSFFTPICGPYKAKSRKMRV